MTPGCIPRCCVKYWRQLMMLYVFLSKVSPAVFMNKLKLLGFVAGVRVLYEICVGLFRSSVVFGVRGAYLLFMNTDKQIVD